MLCLPPPRKSSTQADVPRRYRQSILAAIAGWALAAVLVAGEPASAAEDATIDLSQFQLVFDENFDTLDVSAWGPGTRWIAHTPWKGDFGDAQFADPEPDFPFKVEDGILRIEARKEEDGTWRSGLLASSDPSGAGFHLQFGYFEMRAKLPPGPGVWPAFWLIHNTDADTALEIDVLEYYGHRPDIWHSVVHVWPKYDGADSETVPFQHEVPFGTLTDDFHTYGVNVDEDNITLYLDRHPVGSTPTPMEHMGPMFILLNLALGSGFPIEDTINPSYMYVDYVRAYRPVPPE